MVSGKARVAGKERSERGVGGHTIVRDPMVEDRDGRRGEDDE